MLKDDLNTIIRGNLTADLAMKWRIVPFEWENCPKLS